MTRSENIISMAARLLAAIILLQTLYFKFTGAEESIYIFSKIGMEPWGRIGSGIAELVAAVLLLIPKTIWIGAIMAIGTMCGAIFFHLTSLGIEVKGDGGLLFLLAITVLVCAVTALFIHRRQLPLYK